ncbi:MAG: VCBS repeat-containing protein [Myxococcota bacterium]
MTTAKTAQTASATLLLALGAACGPSNTSIILKFPSDGARTATKQLAVFAFTQDSSTSVKCGAYTQKIPGGQPLGATPVDDPFPFPLDPDRTITNFPAGTPVILVVAYNDTNADTKKPILQGCSDEYGKKDGFSNVEIDMQVILPKKVLIERVSGNRQVGRPGETLSTPLRVRAKAGLSVGTAQELYPLPAVPVQVSLDMGVTDVQLDGKASPITVLTDENGIAEVPVTMPADPATRTVTMASQSLYQACLGVPESQAAAKDKDNCDKSTKKTFTVSTVVEAGAPALLSTLNDPPDIDELVALGVGDFMGGPGVDVAVLGCRGGAGACARGRAAQIPLDASGVPQEGKSRLRVASNVSTSGGGDLNLVPGELGITPGGLFVGPFGVDHPDSIAMVNSRRLDCQARIDPMSRNPSPCEGSEVLLFSSDGTALQPLKRMTLTASNAIGLAGLRESNTAPYTILMTAGQGRRTNAQACTDSLTCLPDHQYECVGSPATWDCARYPDTCASTNTTVDCHSNPSQCSWNCTRACFFAQVSSDPELQNMYSMHCTDKCIDQPDHCGCPPNEKCEPQPADNEHGLPAGKRCVAQDKIVDQIALRAGDLDNPSGCQVRVARCLKGNRDQAAPRVCTCGDVAHGNHCAQRCDSTGTANCPAQDNCACFIPDQISIGDQSGVVAADLSLGRLRGGADVDKGPDIAVATDGGLDLISRSVAGFKWEVRKTPTKSTQGVRAIDLDNNAQIDLFWWSKQACDDYENSDEQCPLSRQPAADGKIDGQTVLGCAGFYIRAKDMKIGTIDDDGCRRFLLPFRPDGACSGDFNGDGKLDVAMASYDSKKLFLYLGDARGGLRDPPQALDIPGGSGGGMLACPDVDGDGRSDVIIANRHGGVAVVRATP